MASNGEIFRIVPRLYGPEGQDAVNVWHFRADFGTAMPDSVFANAVCDALKNCYSTLNDVLSTQWTPADIKIDCVTMVGGVETVVRALGTYAWPSGFDPADAHVTCPPQVAALVKFATAGVRTLGRKFLPAMSVYYIANPGVLNSTALAAIVSWADDLVSGFSLGTGLSLYPVVWGKRAGAWLQLLSAVADAALSTQRRRKAGVGS